MSTQLRSPVKAGRTLSPIVAAVLGFAPFALAWAIGVTASNVGRLSGEGGLSNEASAVLVVSLAGLALLMPGWVAWLSGRSSSGDLALALFAVAIGLGLALLLASQPVSIRGVPVTSRRVLFGMFVERLIPVVIAAGGTFVATEAGAAVMRRTRGWTSVAGWIAAAAIWVVALLPVIARVLLASPTT